MPFPKWAVEPVFLVRKPLPPDKTDPVNYYPDKAEPGNFYPVVNAALVSCLRQLACVAKIADRIFDEIGCECRQIAERTERLKDKIHICNEIVSDFNARAVQDKHVSADVAIICLP
ncbi:hypothetical protein JTE90_020499 [Oedothorax gibbosus]|uniref:Uncharacterized protein n=1 Tax=Oedothorax gibbosus TaxID=931172 RepID=A0AAV6UTD3_9ARAC|nr:hypothetical protein JTE90_020499 [Oedothorax gibbosus]